MGWAHREMQIELKDLTFPHEIQMKVILLTHIKTGMYSDSSNCTACMIQICMLWGFGSMNAKILADTSLVYFANFYIFAGVMLL